MLCYWHLWIKKNLSAYLCKLLAAFWTFLWQMSADIHIPYSFIHFLDHSSGSVFHPQWQWISNKLFWQWFERCWQISKCLYLCSSVSCLAMHLAQSLQKISMLGMIPGCNHEWFSMSSNVTLLSFRIVAQAHTHFTLVKHCSQNVLKVFDRFWPLVYPQLTKIGSMHAALFGA
jgi:hypothetical protein